MFCPGLWVAPPRPPDAPPLSRRVIFGYKVVGGFALSQILLFTPPGSRCSRDSLCDLIHAHDSLLARSALRLGTTPHSPASPPPISRPYTSSLLKTTCPFVVIPPRPAPTCLNTDMHPTFEWAPQSPVPSLVLAQRSCPSSSIPIFPGDERTYVHPTITPYPLPRPTDAAPISRVLLIAVWVCCRSFLGCLLAIVRAALIVPTKIIVLVGGTRRYKYIMDALYHVRQHALVVALFTFTQFVASIILMWFYLVGDANVMLVLASTYFVGMVVDDGQVVAIGRKVRHPFFSFIPPYSSWCSSRCGHQSLCPKLSSSVLANSLVYCRHQGSSTSVPQYVLSILIFDPCTHRTLYRAGHRSSRHAIALWLART
jgi:hypothetical protein